MRIFGFRPLLALGAIAAVVTLIAADVSAAPRMNFGSRGSRTFQAPPPTATAPSPARPIERSMTQPGQSTQPGVAARPTTPGMQPGGFFNRPGLLGGLAAGFLGAGLFGLLFGHGLTGGLGGLASFLGLVLQLGLVAIVAYLIWTWWQRRSQPAFAGGPSLRNVGSDYSSPRPNLGGGYGVGSGAGATASASGGDEIGTTPADFDTFERMLGEIQIAYGNEDLGKLRRLLTPEMASYFADELAANASRGIVNRVSDVKLLQGDLAEAWREGDREYATVAMRYAINDQMVERDSGRVVEGGPQEVTEVWTFVRVRGGSWLLSAIQQV